VALAVGLPQSVDACYHAQGVLTPVAGGGEGRASDGDNAQIGTRLRLKGGPLLCVKAEDLEAQGSGMDGEGGVTGATIGGGDVRQLGKSGHSSAKARV
jgi:hypothetical protein